VGVWLQLESRERANPPNAWYKYNKLLVENQPPVGTVWRRPRRLSRGLRRGIRQISLGGPTPTSNLGVGPPSLANGVI
jgi:hypothetical protein